MDEVNNDIKLQITEELKSEIKKEFEKIVKALQKTVLYAKKDPEISLHQARKVAEEICRRLFIKEISENLGNLMLGGLIEKLYTKKVIPRKVKMNLSYIQDFGNYGSHPQDDVETISDRSVNAVLEALTDVVTWYFTDYSNADIDIDFIDIKYNSRLNEITNDEEKDLDDIQWNRAVEKDTIEAYSEYLSVPGERKYSAKALERIEEIDYLVLKDEEAWEVAKSINTSEAYKSYLNGSTNKAYYKEALSKFLAIKKAEELDERAWIKVHTVNTVNSYMEYIQGNTLKNHLAEAYEKLKSIKELDEDESYWISAKEENTLEAYRTYLSKGIAKLHAEEAKQYILKFELQLMDEQNWSQAKIENTIEAYQRYIDGNTLKNYAEEAHACIKNIEEDKRVWEKICRENTIVAYENYLNGNTLKVYKEEALGYLKNLNEEEIRRESEKQDKEAWNIACNENNIEAYKAYVNGLGIKSYIVQASSKIEQLQNDMEQNLEEQNWKGAKIANTIEAFNRYITKSTLKKYEQQANQKIGELEEIAKLQSEEELWKKAVNINTKEAYLNYINESDLKKYKSEAESRINIIVSRENLYKKPSPEKTVKSENMADTPKETINERGNSISNLNCGGIVAVQGDSVYFKIAKWLYKSKLDGSCLSKVINKEARYINVVGNWIYFADYHLYKVKCDGTDLVKISDRTFPISVTVKGDWIYFIERKRGEHYGKIYRIRTDGSQETVLSNAKAISMNICDNCIYFIKRTMFGATVICKINLDGSNETEIIKDKAKFIVVRHNFIYYSNYNGIYRANDKGKNKFTIADDGIFLLHGFIIHNNLIYYISGHDYNLKCIDLDGKNKRTICKLSSDYRFLSAVGEYMYTGNYDEGTCKISLKDNKATIFSFNKDNKNLMFVEEINLDNGYCFKENQSNQKEEKVVLLKDEKGKTIKFEQLDVLIKDGLNYVVLLPVDSNAGEEAEVVIFRYLRKSDGEIEYQPIEDESLLNELFEQFKERIKNHS